MMDFCKGICMESFAELIQQAGNMLMDRSRAEADLIYSISKLEDDARAAIILAYQNIFQENS